MRLETNDRSGFGNVVDRWGFKCGGEQRLMHCKSVKNHHIGMPKIMAKNEDNHCSTCLRPILRIVPESRIRIPKNQISGRAQSITKL